MEEQNIPIDIAVRKLLDWLVSRRLCTRDWHDAAVRIRGKIGVAMQDMPENEAMRQLLAGTHINYFHCLRIVEILKETEADSKNFFGQYGSKRMKDWKEIVRYRYHPFYECYSTGRASLFAVDNISEFLR